MIISNKKPSDWKDLQRQVARILMECGFESEIEKTVSTVRGKIELDVYAEEDIKGRKYSIACECKYWKANIPKNVIHGFRTVISDIGCNIGYIITTSDFQSGSKETSDFTNIELLTWNEFQSKFFESWYENYFSPEITEKLDPILTYSEPFLPKWFEKMTEDDKQAYFHLKDKYDIFGYIIMEFTSYVRIFSKQKEKPVLPLIEKFGNDKQITDRIPNEILNETGYREFLEKCYEFGQIAISDFSYYKNKYSDSIKNIT